ncbi:hypothetical protein Mapa_009701 [Marchantia paleacea]|nr:hypothetical protein Mapa_009701 [Marchantia paleacea]
MAELMDRLSDSLLLEILEKVADVNSLGRLGAVSKRLQQLVQQVSVVVVKVDSVVAGEESSLSARERILTHFVQFVVGRIVRPLHALQHLLGREKRIVAEVSRHTPLEVLRNFRAVENLRIVLPRGDVIEKGVLLRWKAEFGSSLESCVMLGADSVVNAGIQKSGHTKSAPLDNGRIPESFYGGDLKLRVIWTISCFFAASQRHTLLQEILLDHPTLEHVMVLDADGQGTMCMDRDQLLDFQAKSAGVVSPILSRGQVPLLNIKLWYAPVLDLPGGIRLKGASLIAIRPSNQPVGKQVEAYVSDAFEEPYTTAASSLIRRHPPLKHELLLG